VEEVIEGAMVTPLGDETDGWWHHCDSMTEDNIWMSKGVKHTRFAAKGFHTIRCELHAEEDLDSHLKEEGRVR
jgi:hypothetical protein